MLNDNFWYNVVVNIKPGSDAFCPNLTTHAQVWTILVQYSFLFGSRCARYTLLTGFQRKSKDVTLHHQSKCRLPPRLRAVPSTYVCTLQFVVVLRCYVTALYAVADLAQLSEIFDGIVPFQGEECKQDSIKMDLKK